jgi:signal transduction histidine kinase/ActR/RegA family two-component response regulator
VRPGLLQRLPIREKLVAMIMLTATIVLALAGGSYLIWEFYRARSDMARDLSAEARLILDNTQAALQFHEPTSAQSTLQTLSVDPHVRAVCLYDVGGRLFASFLARVEAEGCPATPLRDQVIFGADRVHLYMASVQDGRTIGTLYIRGDLQVLTSRLRVQTLAILILLVLALGVAWVLSSYLQRMVSEPVTQLAQTAAAVSARGDYSLRARRSTDDELGALVEAFNRMMERIEEREADLSRANVDLRREVADRQRAEQERAELLIREREANRLKDEFLATLSHELRTPLNAILGWTRLLRAKAVPVDSSDRALEKVERNAQVQARLIDDLLEVSRITTGKLRLDIRPVDLVAVVNAAVESIRPTAEVRGVSIDRQIGAVSLPTLGDPDRLQQVVWNLLSNAVKFTPAAGKVLVRLERHDDDERDELVVRDTGIGINPAFLPNVFDTFRQADASSTRQYGGLGLGLSIVRRLVELHGGTVRAESAGQGTGATFTVHLPVRRPERLEPAPELAAPEHLSDTGVLSARRILVVDDEPDTREMVTSVLNAAGASVASAASADEALRLAVEWRPDVLVSDIAMPGTDGYSLMEQITATLSSSSPRIAIALTAYAGERDRQRAFAAGFHHHLPKPVDPLALARMIGELLTAADGSSSAES